MATIVIVHGGWGGGWEWTPVAGRLRERGHDVFTPTLTGPGERSHLGSDTTGLSDYIRDVLAILTFEELQNVVLCGHSYGGMVVTGAADRVPERIRGLVYLDALVPTAGQALVDLVPRELGDPLLGAAAVRGDGKIPYPPELHPPAGLISAEVRSSYLRRMRPHPARTKSEPIRLSGAVSGLPRAFVRCTGDLDPDTDVLGPFAARAQAEGWPYHESSTPHDLHLFDAKGTAQIIEDLAISLG